MSSSSVNRSENAARYRRISGFAHDANGPMMGWRGDRGTATGSSGALAIVVRLAGGACSPEHPMYKTYRYRSSPPRSPSPCAGPWGRERGGDGRRGGHGDPGGWDQTLTE